LDAGEWAEWAGAYDAADLAIAIKPLLLRHLVGRDDPGTDDDDDDAVAFLDAGVVVYHPFAEVFDAAARAGVALTPRLLRPDTAAPDPGLLSTGFVAVGRRGVPFLEWWRAQVATGGPAAEERTIDAGASFFAGE